MARYAVTAQAFDRRNGEPAAGIRTEVVDAGVNILFTRCRTILDVKEAYEAFWNHLNERSEHIVFVQRIEVLA